MRGSERVFSLIRGKMGEQVKKHLFQPKNVTITCSSSGKLTMSLVDYWRDNCFLPLIGDKSLLLSDSYPEQSREETYLPQNCKGKHLGTSTLRRNHFVARHFVVIISSQDTSSHVHFVARSLRRTFTSSHVHFVARSLRRTFTSSQDTSSQKFFSVMFVAKQFHLFTKLTLFFYIINRNNIR